MNTVACTICEKKLEGGLDTFGPIEAPMCWTCWSSDNEWLTPVHDTDAPEDEEPNLMPIRP